MVATLQSGPTAASLPPRGLCASCGRETEQRPPDAELKEQTRWRNSSRCGAAVHATRDMKPGRGQQRHLRTAPGKTVAQVRTGHPVGPAPCVDGQASTLFLGPSNNAWSDLSCRPGLCRNALQTPPNDPRGGPQTPKCPRARRKAGRFASPGTAQLTITSFMLARRRLRCRLNPRAINRRIWDGSLPPLRAQINDATAVLSVCRFRYARNLASLQVASISRSYVTTTAVPTEMGRPDDRTRRSRIIAGQCQGANVEVLPGQQPRFELSKRTTWPSLAGDSAEAVETQAPIPSVDLLVSKSFDEPSGSFRR